MPVGGKPLTLILVAQASQNRLATSLPFIVQAVKCDNYTGQWLWLAEANDWIPPFYTDRIILLPEVSSLTVVAVAPPGYVQAAPVAGQQANFTPYSDFVMPASGVYQPPAAQVPSEAPMGLSDNAPSLAPLPNTTVTRTIDMPLYGLGIIFSPGFGGTFAVYLGSGPGLALTPRLVSQQTGQPTAPPGAQYWQLLPPDYITPVQAQGDPSLYPNTKLTIQVTAGASQSGPSLSYFALGPSQLVWNQADRPLYTTPGSPGQSTKAGSQPVVLPSDQGFASGIVPGAKVATFDNPIAAGASFTLVAAVAGQWVYCLGVRVKVISTGAVVVNLEDDVGVPFGAINTSTTGESSYPLFGARNTQGHPVRLRNTGGVSSGSIDVALVYIQSATDFE